MSNDEQALEVVQEEYRKLVSEIDVSLNRRVSIVQFGLAFLGAAVVLVAKGQLGVSLRLP